MKCILLIDVDSTIPNVPLMKISAGHKNCGDHVFLNKGCDPDKVYISCVFSWNKAKALGIAKMFSCEVEVGGYGVSDRQLPSVIEHMMPDYSLYPNMDFSMGYTSRGCLRRCKFCIVWKKEGTIRDHASIGEFWNPSHRKLVLLDNNFLASPKWKQNIEFLITHRIATTFCQGLDIRLVNDENALWLSLVNSQTMSFGHRMYYFAFDDPALEDRVRKGVAILRKHGIKPYHLTFYLLCGFSTSHEEDMHRFKVIREWGAHPYVMKFNDRRDDVWLNHFDRWVNAHIYKACRFEDYKPLKNSLKRLRV